MPRIAGIYSPPHDPVITATPIESVEYNGTVADLAVDLNAPRPIVAGGTGASNAHDAMIALSGEIANQVVTNYDTFPFVSGSFASAIGATSAPVAGRAFAGICYLPNADVNYCVLEARDITDSENPGRVHVREKRGGTWGSWAEQPSSLAALEGRYVNVTGDTMTGALTVSAAIASAGSATTGAYYFGSSGTKYLSYDGANFNLVGGQLAVPGIYVGSSGNVNCTGSVSSGALGASGTYYFGNTGTKYLQYDGTNFKFAGGAVMVGESTFSSTGIELGSTSVPGPTVLDFHSSGTGADYDSRIISTGGSSVVAQGTLAFLAAAISFSTTPTAPTPAGSDDSTKVATTAFVKALFPGAAAQNGYQKSPTGIIIQWGVSSSAAAEYTIAFPITFPNATFAVIAGNSYPSTGTDRTYVIHADFNSTSALNLRKRLAVNGGSVSQTSDGIPISWIAIGN